MAQKELLESKESECSTAQDYVALAREALADPSDPEYARHLLDQAETAAQMPPDYIAVAECATELGDDELAMGIYEQAEEMCFEPLEFAAVGHSLATHTDQADKAKTLLERAADEASKPSEFLIIAGYASSDLNDESLAAQLRSKVDANAKSLEDYRKLVQGLVDSGEHEMAKSLFKKAERYCSGIEETLSYAKQIQQLFDDGEWARSILEEAEGSCQFPKDFAQLATGFKSLFGDQARVESLMQQAAEFAMTGEEQLDLGNGYWDLLQDKDAAIQAYRKAVPDLNDKQTLLTLGARIGKEIGDPELAKTLFDKVEQKSSGPAELRKLAQTVLAALGDREYAAEIYVRAAETMDQPNDLMSLAADLAGELNDSQKAGEVYRKAFARQDDFGQYLKLLEQVEKHTGDSAFCREILVKAADRASGTPELLTCCERIMAVLQDSGMCRPLLASAEAQVTSVGEMKNLLQAVQKHFPDDGEWIAQAEEKLALREANQAKYAVFQAREKHADNFIKLIQLTDDMMLELRDVHYARKLLDAAEKKMEEQGFDLNQANTLVQSISSHLSDGDWSQRLLDAMAKRADSFGAVRRIAQTAIRFLGEAGRQLAAGYFEAWQARLGENSGATGYDFTKLAGAVNQDLGDNEWAARLLTSAEGIGGDRFFWVHMGDLANQIGDGTRAWNFFRKAAESCADPQQALQITSRLLTINSDREAVASLYRGIGERMTSPRHKLAWADGILGLFHDKEWARKVFDEIKPEMTSGSDREIFERRRALQLGHSLRR